MKKIVLIFVGLFSTLLILEYFFKSEEIIYVDTLPENVHADPEETIDVEELPASPKAEMWIEDYALFFNTESKQFGYGRIIGKLYRDSEILYYTMISSQGYEITVHKNHAFKRVDDMPDDLLKIYKKQMR